MPLAVQQEDDESDLIEYIEEDDDEDDDDGDDGDDGASLPGEELSTDESRTADSESDDANGGVGDKADHSTAYINQEYSLLESLKTPAAQIITSKLQRLMYKRPRAEPTASASAPAVQAVPSVVIEEAAPVEAEEVSVPPLVAVALENSNQVNGGSVGIRCSALMFCQPSLDGHRIRTSERFRSVRLAGTRWVGSMKDSARSW